jgi:hypothetical protein
VEKINELAMEMAGMLHNGQCAVRAVNRILELENTFASDARYGAKKSEQSDDNPNRSQVAFALDSRN